MSNYKPTALSVFGDMVQGDEEANITAVASADLSSAQANLARFGETFSKAKIMTLTKDKELDEYVTLMDEMKEQLEAVKSDAQAVVNVCTEQLAM